MERQGANKPKPLGWLFCAPWWPVERGVECSDQVGGGKERSPFPQGGFPRKPGCSTAARPGPLGLGLPEPKHWRWGASPPVQ